jgi:hypothetical protein
MSVQLILYPQNYNGQFNAVSNVADEKLVDGINFNNINASSSYDAPSLLFSDPITNQPPNIINTWYRWRSTATGTATLPTEISGNLYLYTVSTNVVSGVYQKLSNLVVGQTYILSVAFDNPNNGFIDLIHRDGNNPTSNPSIQSYDLNTWPFDWATLYFGAVTTEDIVQIGYTYGAAETFKITAMSVVPAGTAPTGTNFHLEDGQVLCDLYQEEDIPLTLSVDDFKNVAEKVQSYSKDFNLPATKRNNLIFDHIFEITRIDDGIIFNPYIKTQCLLKQDGYILFEGYLRLIDVQDQKGEISYNVNLYSEVVALADILKDRTFSDLDFTELEHDYQKTNIKNSWNDSPSAGITYLNSGTSGYRDANNTVKYPFVDWSHQILLSDGTNGILGTPELSRLEQAFRPFINIKYLIDRIFQDTPFNWTSEFFDSDDFGKLYMDFNWGGDNTPVLIDVTSDWGMFTYGDSGVGSGFPSVSSYATTLYSVMKLNTTTGSVNFANYLPPNYNTSTHIITSTAVNEYYTANYNYDITNTDSVSRTVECRWLYNTTPIDYSGVVTLAAGASYLYSGSLSQQMLNIGDTLQVQFKSDAVSVVRQTQTAYPNNITYTNYTTGVLNITSGIILQTLRGETGQWEFLKGIMTMFNIVSLPDKDNPLNITFAPYADVFISDTAGTTLASRSIVHDWTDKVDVSEMKLMPLTDLNKNTIFKFVEDDDDYTFSLYKKSTSGHLYGSKVYDASAYTILEGTKEIVAEPFAATVPKPLFNQFPDFITPAIFTSNDEATEFEGFENAPRIMYNNGKQTLDAGVTYYIPDQNGLSSENQPEFLQFSHLTDIPTIPSIPNVAGTKDFHFGECQYFDPIGATVPDNLFNFYWLPYYNELYNPNTRIMTMKVNLSPADINTFKMNDRVMIKNRSFRVNKIDYKPNDLATVEFILIP